MMLLILGLAFAVGAAIAVGLALVVSRVPDVMTQRKIDSRMQEIAFGDAFEAGKGTTKTKALLKSQNAGPLPGIELAIGGTARGFALAGWIKQSGTKASLSAVLIASVIMGVVGGDRDRRRHSRTLVDTGRFRRWRLLAVPGAAVQAEPADARVRRAVPGGARPDCPRLEGGARVRHRAEDGGRRAVRNRLARSSGTPSRSRTSACR